MSGEGIIQNLFTQLEAISSTATPSEQQKNNIQSIRNAIEKALALPEDVNIYYYAGHANDLCDPQTKKPVLKKVPEGCIYVTIAECGMPTAFSENEARERAFTDFDYETKEIIRYAYLPKNLFQFAQLIHTNPETIHFHFPGDSYVVNEFFPIAYHRLGSGPALGVSGLLDKAKMEQNLGDPKLVKIPSYDLSAVFNALNKDSYTKEEVLSLCDQYKITESPAKNESFFENMFPNSHAILTMKDVKNFFSELSIAVVIPEIINQYKTSVYPTLEDVYEIFSRIAPGEYYFSFTPEIKQRFQQEIITKLREQSGSTNPTWNTTMMELFPGIHFNLMCRSVSDDCYPKALRRRANSMNLASKKQNIFSKKATQGGKTKKQKRRYRKKRTTRRHR